MSKKNEILSEIVEKAIVKHATSSTSKAPNGMSWIDYWVSKMKYPIPDICPCCKEKTTDTNPMVGAHVVKVIDINAVGRKFYIIPTCKNCNDTYKGVKSYKLFIVPTCLLCEIESQDTSS